MYQVFLSLITHFIYLFQWARFKFLIYYIQQPGKKLTENNREKGKDETETFAESLFVGSSCTNTNFYHIIPDSQRQIKLERRLNSSTNFATWTEHIAWLLSSSKVASFFMNNVSLKQCCQNKKAGSHCTIIIVTSSKGQRCFGFFEINFQIKWISLGPRNN